MYKLSKTFLTLSVCLQDIFEQGMEGIVRRLWPRLPCVVCITGGTNALYKTLLEKSFCKGMSSARLSHLQD